MTSFVDQGKKKEESRTQSHLGDAKILSLTDTNCHHTTTRTQQDLFTTKGDNNTLSLLFGPKHTNDIPHHQGANRI